MEIFFKTSFSKQFVRFHNVFFLNVTDILGRHILLFMIDRAELPFGQRLVRNSLIKPIVDLAS